MYCSLWHLTQLPSDLKFLTHKDAELLKALANPILSKSDADLDSNYVAHIDEYLFKLPSHLQSDIKMLLRILNMPGALFPFVFSFKKFTDLREAQQRKLLKKWMNSPIPLLRTGYSALKAICAWGYYSREPAQDEIGYLGPTVGNESKLPTLLNGEPEPTLPSNNIDFDLRQYLSTTPFKTGIESHDN